MKTIPFPWNFELNCWGVGGWESSRLLGHMGKEDLSLKLVGYPDCCFSHSEPPWSRVSHPILLFLCFQLGVSSKVQEALAIFSLSPWALQLLMRIITSTSRTESPNPQITEQICAAPGPTLYLGSLPSLDWVSEKTHCWIQIERYIM